MDKIWNVVERDVGTEGGKENQDERNPHLYMGEVVPVEVED